MAPSKQDFTAEGKKAWGRYDLIKDLGLWGIKARGVGCAETGTLAGHGTWKVPAAQFRRGKPRIQAGVVPSRYSPACPSALDEESEMVCFQDPCPKTQASLPARCNPPLVHRTSNAGGSPPMIRTSTSGHHLPHAIRSRPPSPWPPLHCTHCTHRTHQLDTTERISGPRLIDDPRLAGTAGRASPLMAPRHLRHALI
jgi:hypothetical protein